MKKKHGKKYNIVLGSAMALLLVLLIVVNVLTLNVYSTAITSFFTKLEATDAEVETTQDDWNAIAAEVESEGIVLLKNENNTLPLSGVDAVNLLGYRSYNHVYSGTGSGSTDSTNAVTLTDALATVGITANPALEENGVYTVSFTDDTEGSGLFARFMGAGFVLTTEPDISAFTGDCSFESLKAYSDVAIVTLGRAGGEGSDLTSAEAEDLDGAETYLALSDSEKELLEYATETFETVIVLVNSGNAMELGCLEDYDIDAALWIGDVGSQGMLAVAQVLVGEVNPSGRLTDTYAYDATSAPSYANFGDYTFSNYDSTYVNYVESIYVGYKWYETADEEGFFDDVSNEYGTGYDAVVQFPFGYGLSYTEFTQSITGGTADGSTLSAGEDITIEVTVENTGDVAGKDVVELYYSAPYTNGGIEKASVNLIDYDKTEELEAGTQEVITITVAVDDMASYDTTANNGEGAYVLEAGEYTLSIRSDAHTVLDSVTFAVEEDIVYSEDGVGARSSDEQIAVNQFDDCDNDLIYLSRADGFANYEEAMTQDASTATDAIISSIENYDSYDEALDEAVTVSYTEGVDYGASGSLTLADMAGLDYDDEQWDELLNQMTLSEMQTLVGSGGWSTAEVSSIEKTYETHIDGPQGLVRVVGSTPILGTAYPSSVVQAATWNKELIEKYASYYADEAHTFGVSGLYAPSFNIHRSPFGGRNYEYYSEDAVLSGYTAASFVTGAQSKGMICYLKHFALNEQDTNRASTCTFANEQSIREIYLKGYEIAVKTSDVTAVMSSMNRIGATWTGAHRGLLTEVLRNEWGFQGFVLTDSCESEYMKSTAAGLRAGNDMWLYSETITPSADTDADIYYLRQACKNILYAEANADVVETEVAPWRLYVAAVDAVLVIAFVACGVALIRNVRKREE